MKTVGRHRLFGLALGAVSLIALASCGMTDDEVSQSYDDFVTVAQPVKVKDIQDFCKVPTDRGQIDLEEYLANVVSCEAAPTAGLETMKAQAIAARSFAMGIVFGRGRALISSEADQHYDCGRPTRDLARQAVKETTGVVGQYNDTLVSMYYKAGSTNQSAQCRGIGAGVSGTECMITYNEGKTGSAVRGSAGGNCGSLPSTNNNRGDMGQYSAVCLENKGKKALDILRFFYGDDIETVQLDGPCIGDTVDEEVLTDGAVCTAQAERPKINERSVWGARPPAALQDKHTPNRITIHHTASTNDASVDPGMQMRGFQSWHMDNNGWADIGYHFLIDRKGNIYRGAAEDRIGTHVGGQNTGNLGISFFGQHHPPDDSFIQSSEPTEAALKAAGSLVSYLAKKYNIDVTAPGKLMGHRDNPGQATSCPGDLLHKRLDEIRNYAGSGAICSRPERPYDEVRDVPEFDLESAKYRYIKVKTTSSNPKPNPTSVKGFEVDSVMFQKTSSADANYASSVYSSSSGVKNPRNALGSPKNTSCDEEQRENSAARVPVGDELVLKFDKTFGAESLISLVQGELGGLDGCNTGYTADLYASPDAKKWVKISTEVSSNVQGLEVPAPYVHFISPREGGVYASGSFSLAVEASPDVQSVEYFLGGTSIGTGTDWNNNFRYAYDIDKTGKIKLTARAKGVDGQTLATETISLDLSNAFRFSSPKPGSAGLSALAPKEATFKVVGGPPEIASVTYEADGYGLGSTADAGSDFKLEYEFTNASEEDGFRHIIAYGENAEGEIIATAELEVLISEHIQDKIEWVTPGNGGWNTPKITLRSRRLDPEIISVDYSIKDKKAVCRSDNFDTDFACTHKFKERGWVELVATGYNSKEQLEDPAEREAAKIGEATIRVFIANEDGSVPGYDTDYGAPPAPDGSSGFGTGEADSELAEKLAVEGRLCSNRCNGGSEIRCSGGAMGWTSGKCWEFAKSALICAGVTDRPGLNRLAAKAGMTENEIQIPGGGLAIAGDRVSPEELAETVNLQKVDVTPDQAPRGSIVSWPPGCAGYNGTYGHVEIAQGDGTACSDYCGRLKSASCGRVFIPVR